MSNSLAEWFGAGKSSLYPAKSSSISAQNGNPSPVVGAQAAPNGTPVRAGVNGSRPPLFISSPRAEPVRAELEPATPGLSWLAERAPRPAAPAPHLSAAADFLCHVAAPAGLVAVAAIIPNGRMEGHTFDLPREGNALAAWIAEREGRANLYFTPNEPVFAEKQAGKNGKVTEADIAAVRGVFVDLGSGPINLS